MAETQSPTAEARLAALEARLGQVESALLRVPGPTGPYRVIEGPSGAFAIISCGLPPWGLSFVEKAVEGLMRPGPTGEMELPAEPWKHLVARRHLWRRQLYVKGRNMTVRQLVGSVKANQFTEEQAAANYDLPVEAIREALAYAEANAELLDLEAAYERFLLAQGGKRRGPQPVT